MTDEEWVNFPVRTAVDFEADTLVAWLKRWGWTGKVKHSERHSAGTTHLLAVQMKKGEDPKALVAEIRAAWRAHVLSRRSKKRQATN